MIQIEHVSFQYANAKEPALRDVSLTIQKGEFVVLLGSSGCGKTTITRLINRLVPEFFEGELEGRVIVDGQNTDELSIQDLAGVVGSVFQDPRSQFFATDTTAEIAFSCENVGIPREEIFITTKVWVEHYGYEEAKKSVLESMKKLRQIIWIWYCFTSHFQILTVLTMHWKICTMRGKSEQSEFPTFM